jgi:hypothetical protein
MNDARGRFFVYGFAMAIVVAIITIACMEIFRNG